MANETEPEHDQNAAGDPDTAAQFDALAQAASMDDDGDQYIPGAEAEPERDPSEPDPTTVEAIKTMCGVSFGIAASRRGEHWGITEQEADALAYPAAQVVEKWFPEIAVGPEVALILAAGTITMPRIMEDRRIAAERERQEAERERQSRRQADREAEATEGDEHGGSD